MVWRWKMALSALVLVGLTMVSPAQLRAQFVLNLDPLPGGDVATAQADLVVGQEFVVSLPVQMGTGFIWYLFEDEASRHVLNPSKGDWLSTTTEKSGIPGQTERQLFTFLAIHRGSAEMDFGFGPNRSRASARRRATVTVLVR